MKDMKGKKGMTLVIAVGKPSPKSPMDTATADKDEKKKELAQRGFGRLEPTSLAQIAQQQGLPYTQTSDVRPGTNYEGRQEEVEVATKPKQQERLRNIMPLRPRDPRMIQRSDDAFDMVANNARRVLGLAPITFEVGDPADFVAIDAPSIRGAIADAPADRKVFRAGRLVASSTTSGTIER